MNPKKNINDAVEVLRSFEKQYEDKIKEYSDESVIGIACRDRLLEKLEPEKSHEETKDFCLLVITKVPLPEEARPPEEYEGLKVYLVVREEAVEGNT